MGNQVCSCQPGPDGNEVPGGSCPIIPTLQCQADFVNECDTPGNVCTSFQQQVPEEGLTEYCNQPRGCCPGRPQDKDQWLVEIDNVNSPCNGICAEVDIEGCLSLNNNTPAVCAGELGGNIATNPSSELKVTCKWPIDTFTSLEAVNTWLNTYGIETPENLKTWNTKIMPTLCQGFQGNAIDGPGTCPSSFVGGICSDLIANSPTGEICRRWLGGISEDDTEAKAAANETIFGYCRNLANINQILPGANVDIKDGEVNECLCINRGKDPNGTYNQILQAAGSNNDLINSLGKVGCWYAPCNSGTDQLIPLETAETASDYYPEDCPDVCKIVNTFSGTIENSTIKEEINCGGSKPTPPGGTAPPSRTPETRSFLDKYWWVGVLLIIFFLIIILVVFIIFDMEEPSKKKKEQPVLPF